MAYDPLFKDARIVDGSGMPSFRSYLVLFNPDTIRSHAPELVAVNGQVTIEHGRMTGDLPGGLIRANKG